MSAYDIDKLENSDNIELVFPHSYNDVSVIFTKNHITSEMINLVENCCDETPHIYDIAASHQVDKVRVSFEF